MPVPVLTSGTHRPLGRAQSSPASTSYSVPDTTVPSPVTTEPASKLRFTTGEWRGEGRFSSGFQESVLTIMFLVIQLNTGTR